VVARRRSRDRDHFLNDGFARNPIGLRLYYRILGDAGPTLLVPTACWLRLRGEWPTAAERATHAY
jgi:hypothetical protein